MSLPCNLTSVLTIRSFSFGLLQFSDLERQIIQHPFFEATKHVKQLGSVFRYFPSSHQTRFEHMLETCYVSGKWIAELQKNQPELKIPNIWIEWVRLAGLLHDIGHACWSHVFDMFLEHYPEISNQICPEMRDHESRGMLLIQQLWKELKFDHPVEVICDMIAGKRVSKQSQALPQYLFEFVANKYSELDADKLAYLTSDGHSVDLPQNLQLERIFSRTRVTLVALVTPVSSEVKNDLELSHLVWAQHIANDIIQVFVTRRNMFEKIYMNQRVLEYDFQVMSELAQLFEKFPLIELLNDYRENQHRWRFMLTDTMLYSLQTMNKHFSNWLSQDPKMTNELDGLDQQSAFMLKYDPSITMIRTVDIYYNIDATPKLQTHPLSIHVKFNYSRLENSELAQRVLFFKHANNLKYKELVKLGDLPLEQRLNFDLSAPFIHRTFIVGIAEEFKNSQESSTREHTLSPPSYRVYHHHDTDNEKNNGQQSNKHISSVEQGNGDNDQKK